MLSERQRRKPTSSVTTNKLDQNKSASGQSDKTTIYCYGKNSHLLNGLFPVQNILLQRKDKLVIAVFALLVQTKHAIYIPRHAINQIKSVKKTLAQEP